MQDVYECCPMLEGDRYLLRQISQDDCEDMLRVYSDEQSVPLFNSDNCNGDDFHYVTMKRMRSAIEFWLFSYEKRYFVRWSIVDKRSCEVIGTIELFCRKAEDYFTDCGIQRLDLRSDYEREGIIWEILELIVPKAYALFDCSMIATKAVSVAKERICALERMGFTRSDEKLIGHDGAEYGDYFVRMK